ncbi:peptidase M15 [Kribbella antibiotica]|uniref:Peptidase M15 n=1 Tax=Kribbella antibiotica TaxID=190195 RepID=A0A4R4Z4E4_9ACTN|nr:M15 family metallopeptidase [Kribbella antibiotica]TDD52925.1 peptidase M15 [Kribbella antibiotica]
MPKRRRSGNIGPDELFGMIETTPRRSTALGGLAIVAAVTSFALTACAADQTDAAAPPGTPHGKSSGGGRSLPGSADGKLPTGTSAFDTDLPGIANLDPKLRAAVQKAEKAMKEAGIPMQVTTGWRSKKYQVELMDKAIKEYGSREKAKKFVADPDESHHVTGNAVDIGPTDADDWLIRKGNRFGLCQTYSNEIWHFELVTTPGGDCPPMTTPS